MRQCPFQLTRPVWGEPSLDQCRNIFTSISTHSPRVGRTMRFCPRLLQARNFNSLAPCGANLHLRVLIAQKLQFQLTRPVWGEPNFNNSSFFIFLISTHSPRVGRTTAFRRRQDYLRYFNSLAPCGANHSYSVYVSDFVIFQLTRPVWGEPGDTSHRTRRTRRFQLTRPVWGEPFYGDLCIQQI